MACIRKRRGKWVVDYRDGAGRRCWVTCNTREEAKEPKYRLSGQQVCDGTEPLALEPLPERLVELLASSHQLYQRIARRDAMRDGRRA